LPRILFYFVLIFGLLASHFEWLVAGALAAALTYSGSAAIHACLLIWRGPSYGDLDVYALGAILSTSCLITIPLINWSTTLRNLGSHDGHKSGARTIIIYWGGLVLVGLIAILSTIWSTTYYVTNVSAVNPITCHPPSSQMNYSAGQDPSWQGFVVDAEWVHDNGCMDPCQQSSFHWPPAIFRSYSDLQIPSQADVKVLYSSQVVSTFVTYEFFGAIVGFFLLSQGVWALCFGRRNPRQCRGVIYNFLKKVTLGFDSHSSKVGGRGSRGWRKRTAKYIATMAYLWTVVASFLSVVLFTTNIIMMEILLGDLPQSESSAHIGAWSPWSTTGLIVVATFIGKYHKTFATSIIARVRRGFRSAGRSPGERENPSNIQNSEQQTKQLTRDTNMSVFESFPVSQIRQGKGVFNCPGRKGGVEIAQDVLARP